jgi:hypothetical protein
MKKCADVQPKYLQMKHSTAFYLLLLSTGLLISYSYFGHAQDVVINEVMASNSGFYPDEDGAYEDWIELYNAGDEVVNLEGWGLSDDYGNPFRWVFPQYFIEPGEYLWIWASGKDRKKDVGQMHNGIKRRYYSGIHGTAVDQLLNHPSFPDHPEERNVLINYFEAPTDIGDLYGQHLFTWIVAPQTGEYVFRIASDDNSRLYLSMDDSPGNAAAIAEVPGWTQPREWYKYVEQTSVPVFLEEGQIYYLEAFMKEHMGGDNLSVMWEWPDGSVEEPISAAHCFLPERRFHTNFSISAAGEEIILTDHQGVLVDEMPPTEIPTNISYGRKPGIPDEWVYFDSPTPGAINPTEGFAGLSAKPLLSPAGGIFGEAVEVSIFVADPDATIYYTTNGTPPSASNGQEYQGPFTISITHYVRAVAISPGKLQSETAAATYAVANPNVRDFSSNLPVMIIHNLGTPITPGTRTIAYMTLLDNREAGRAVLSNDTEFTGRIKINIRGSSSQMFPKKGFGFHTLEEDDSNRKVSLLGMPGEHNWILHGPYSDKSLMRNAFSYALGEDAGHYSPRTRFIELFMHTGSGQLTSAHYHGVYVLTERIKVAPGRVEVVELEPHHNEYPDVSGGYIFKIDRLNEGEFGFYTDRGSHFIYTRPNELTISNPQRAYLAAYLDSLETALFGDDFANPQIGYAAYMDALSFIDMHLITELTKEIDGFRFSTFFYKDRESKIFAGPLWDFNLALGNASYLQGWIPQGWYYPLISEYEYNRGWYNRLFEDPAFAELYIRRYRSLRLTAFSDLNLMGKILGMNDLLQEAQGRNFERWNILGTYVWPNWFIAGTHQEEIDWMMDWLAQRLEWIDGQLGTPYTMMHYWNFNEQDYLRPTYSLSGGNVAISGSSSLEVTTGSGQDFNGVNARNGGDACEHLRLNNPVGTELDFNLSTQNYKDVTFSYEARRSGSGANRHFVSYTTNGQDFIPFDTLAISEKPTLYTIYFGYIEAVNDNAQFAVRISIDFDPDDEGGTAGNNRFDNVSLDGEALEGIIRPPVQVLPLDKHFEMIEQHDELVIDPGDYFSHPDGMPLTYSIQNPHPQKADISISGEQLIINPIERGGLRFEMDVGDGINPPLRKSIYLLIHPQAFSLNDGSFLFDYWDPNEPEGGFPDHMLFLQGEEDDALIDNPLPFAYSIPPSDYASGDQGNIGFPYRNESRTRINGLWDEGISFINTGRGRDLGAAVLAIDTRNVSEFELNWKAGTLRANSRVYHLRLQYRTGISKPWKDWIDDAGNAVEYQRSTQTGHALTFQDLLVPEELLDNEYAQIRWLYYFTGERLDTESGARDMLGLHMIRLFTESPSHLLIREEQNNLKAYPNPSREGAVYLSRRSSGNVYDIHGRLMLSVFNDDRINVRMLSPGLYFFRSDTGQNIKLIIGY